MYIYDSFSSLMILKNRFMFIYLKIQINIRIALVNCIREIKLINWENVIMQLKELTMQ